MTSERKRKREQFILRDYHSGNGTPFLRCEYLIDLPSLVEAYCDDIRDRERAGSIRHIPESLAEWGIPPDEIEKLRPSVENLINETIGPQVKLCPDFKAAMVAYVRSAQHEILDVAFGLLLDEAR